MNSSISISSVLRALAGALTAAALLAVVLEITLRVLPTVNGVHRESPHTSGVASARLIANHDFTPIEMLRDDCLAELARGPSRAVEEEALA